jgi:Na+/melibiose symporter-like transporter
MPPVFSWRFLTPETRKLLAVYALSMLASSIPAVLVIFYVRDLLGAEHLTGPFLLLYFLSGAAAMPLWKKASARFGKYKAWAFANALAVIGFVGAFFLGAGDVAAYAVVCVASGFALGADLTLPPSILADHIHARGNTAFSGTYYACLAFIGKASLALASAIVLPVLDASGFKPQAVNSSEALLALSTTYALIPCFLKLMAAYLLYTFYSGEKHETI